MKQFCRAVWILTLFFSLFGRSALASTSGTLLISQIYLGTGNGGAQPQSPYVELFNPGNTTVSLSGWSIQYATGTSALVAFALSGSIAPGQYYLISLGIPTAGNVPLPTPDLVISTTLSISNGKFVLMNSPTITSTSCPSDSTVADIVGYGFTDCLQTFAARAPASSDLTALVRKGGGCTNIQSNLADFEAITPVLRNSGSNRNVCTGTSTPQKYSIADDGALSIQSTGSASAPLFAGYATVQPNSNSVAPDGVAIYGLTKGGTLVTETGVPVSQLLTSAVLYIEQAGPATTGVAIANPNNSDVTISYIVTNTNDVQIFFSGSFTMAANTQMASFLNQWPFNLPGVTGLMTLSATQPVGITSLRGYINERNDFLVSTLPVLNPAGPPSSSATYLPHFAANAGWRTDLVLINDSDSPISGTVYFMDPAGNPATVAVGSVTISSLAYSISQRRTMKIILPNTPGAALQTGSVKVLPVPGTTPAVPLGIFSYTPANIRVSEAAMIGTSGTQFRTYVENSGTSGSVGSINSGLAIANLDGVQASVNLQLFKLDGTSAGSTTISIPAGARVAQFLSEMFPSVSTSFKGVMRISSTDNLSVAGLRARYNERSELLITTVPVSPEVTQGSSAQVIFPNIVDAAGYTTQIILLDVVSGQTSAGTMNFFTIGGKNPSVTFQ